MNSKIFFDIKPFLDSENSFKITNFPDNKSNHLTLLKICNKIRELEVNEQNTEAISHLEQYENLISDNFLKIYFLLNKAKIFQKVKEISKYKTIINDCEENLEKFRLSFTKKEYFFLYCVTQILKSRFLIFNKSFIDAQHSLEIANRLAAEFQFQYERAEIFNLKAKIKFLNTKFIESLNFSMKSLKIYEELENRKKQAWILNNIGLVEFHCEKFEKSIQHLNQAQQISLFQKDIKNVANTESNLGLLYFNLGYFKKAEQKYHASLNHYKEINEIQKSANIMSNIGELYSQMDKFSEAKSYLDEAMSIYKKLEIEYHQIEPLHNYLLIALKMSQKDVAMKYYKRMLSLYNKFPEKIDEIYLKIANLQIVVQFEELGSLKDFLEQVREIFNNPNVRFEFRIKSLISMAQIINSKMIDSNNLDYLPILNEILDRMEQFARKSLSYYILANIYLIKINISYLNNNKNALKDLTKKFTNLSQKLNLSELDNSIQGIRRYQAKNNTINVSISKNFQKTLFLIDKIISRIN